MGHEIRSKSLPKDDRQLDQFMQYYKTKKVFINGCCVESTIFKYKGSVYRSLRADVVKNAINTSRH